MARLITVLAIASFNLFWFWHATEFEVATDFWHRFNMELRKLLTSRWQFQLKLSDTERACNSMHNSMKINRRNDQSHYTFYWPPAIIQRERENRKKGKSGKWSTFPVLCVVNSIGSCSHIRRCVEPDATAQPSPSQYLRRWCQPRREWSNVNNNVNHGAMHNISNCMKPQILRIAQCEVLLLSPLCRLSLLQSVHQFDK